MQSVHGDAAFNIARPRYRLICSGSGQTCAEGCTGLALPAGVACACIARSLDGEQRFYARVQGKGTPKPVAGCEQRVGDAEPLRHVPAWRLLTVAKGVSLRLW